MPQSKLLRSVRHVPPVAKQPPKPATVGAGDLVASVAQPIARLIDLATGKPGAVSSCAGCGQRKASLNEAVPDVLAIPKHIGKIIKHIFS